MFIISYTEFVSGSSQANEIRLFGGNFRRELVEQ